MLCAFNTCSDDDDGDSVPEFTVTAVSPELGTIGTEVTITGTNFPLDVSLIDITIGGTPAIISSLSSSQIVTTVPVGASSGDISISTSNFTQTAPTSFTVLENLELGTIENLLNKVNSSGQSIPLSTVSEV